MYNIPEISRTSGPFQDGHAFGTIKESLLIAALEGSTECAVAKVYRVDLSGSATILSDETAAATAFSQNGWMPFGAASNMSDGDGFLVGCTVEVQALLIRVDTASTHNGAIKVYDSVDGVWASNLLATTDNTNNLKTPGYASIIIPDNPQRAAFSPSRFPINGSIPATLRYFFVRLEGFTAGTPPLCGGVTPIRKSFVNLDHTAILNGDTATTPAGYSHFLWPGMAMEWGFGNRAIGADVYLKQASTVEYSDAHEYLSTSGEWKALQGWANTSNDFSALAPAKYQMRWTVPADWTARTREFVLESGATVSYTAYWIRERVIGVNSYGPRPMPIYRMRGKMFGAGNVEGLSSPALAQVRNIRVARIGQHVGEAVQIQVANLTTGTTATASITGEAPMVYPLTATVSIGPTDVWDIVWQSGGALYDVSAIID